MDILQIVIAVSIALVALTIVGLGIAFISILKEVRLSLQKVNSILEDTTQIASAVKSPILSISEMFLGFRDGMRTFNGLFSKNKK